MSIDHQEILKWFELDKKIYQLACTARRLTFQSQQQRAFNLIWAINKEEKLQGKRIAVVGAGIGGLAAAAAGHVLGAKVMVYEQKADVLPLQRGNITRHVHPNIYTWPKAGSTYPVTHLPYFNWYDATAGEVVATLLNQWNELDIEQTFLCQVSAINFAENKVRVDFEDGRRKPEYFDLCIAAVGFGVEKELSKTHTPSYWRNDDLDQPVLDYKPILEYVVTGVGDGGLLDVIRLKIKDFCHRDFIEWITRSDWFKKHADSIYSRLERNEDPKSVWNDFERETIPSDVTVLLDSIVRKDTVVKLNHKGGHHFGTDASLLHQLIVSLLISRKEVIPVSGEYLEYKEDRSKSPSAKIVVISGEKGKFEITPDRFILRGGADPALESLSNGFTKAKKFWKEHYKKDPTFESQYPGYFLLNEFMKFEWEEKYAVTFGLGEAEDLDKGVKERPQALKSELNALGKIFAIEKLHDELGVEKSRSYKVVSEVTEQEMHCTFEILNGAPIQTDNGRVAGPFVRVTVSHRELLERLLANDRKAYHVLTYYMTEKGKDIICERQRNLETNVHIVHEKKGNGCFHIISHKGMFQTHRLLRVRSIIEIMQNRWSLYRVQRIGWQLLSTYEKERLLWRSVWQPPGT